MKRFIVSGLVALLVAAIPSAFIARVPPGLTARLDGRSIALERVGGLYCRDFDYPLLRCFSSATRLEADVLRRSRAAIGSPRASSLNAVSYVRIFEHEQYDGAYASQPPPNW